MAERNTHTGLMGTGILVDQNSATRNHGRQIDWAHVSTDYIPEDSLTGKKILPAGTAVGDSLGAHIADGARPVSPRVDTTNPAIGLLETTAVEGDRGASITGYSILKGGVVYENMLPDADPTTGLLDEDVAAELQQNGTGFAFERYVNSLAS